MNIHPNRRDATAMQSYPLQTCNHGSQHAGARRPLTGKHARQGVPGNVQCMQPVPQLAQVPSPLGNQACSQKEGDEGPIPIAPCQTAPQLPCMQNSPRQARTLPWLTSRQVHAPVPALQKP